MRTSEEWANERWGFFKTDGPSWSANLQEFITAIQSDARAELQRENAELKAQVSALHGASAMIEARLQSERNQLHEENTQLRKAVEDCICTLGFANPETEDGKVFWQCRERLKSLRGGGK